MSQPLDILTMLLKTRSSKKAGDVEKVKLHVRELFHRESLWVKKLGMTDLMPCVDIAELLGGAEVSRDVLDRFSESHFATSTGESRVCRNYLRWQALLDTKDWISPFQLPDPFEPLLELFSAGGGFSIEHGWYLDFYAVDLRQGGRGGLSLRSVRALVLNSP